MRLTAIDPRHFKRPESALVVVHTTAEALLIKRADHADFWQSVTGTLSWNESPMDAAIRELEEETGIQADALRATGIVRSYEILPQWRYRYPPNVERNREHLFFYHLNHVCEVVLQEDEHTDYQWLSIEQAVDKVWSWSNKLALMSLL